jgi:4-amino-4-deoxy-L-arabinose transferase-like glycosyltransferase
MDTSNPSHDRLVGGLVSALLAGLGVWLLTRTPVDGPLNALLPGLLCLLAGAVLMGWLFRNTSPCQTTHEEVTYLVHPPIFVLSGLVLSAAVCLTIQQTITTRWESWLQLGFWLLSVLLVVVGFLRAAEWRPPNLHTQWQLILANRWEALTVAVIIIVAFAVRVVNLEVFPYAFANDEAWVGLEGLHILTGEPPMGFFTVGWSSQPMLSFLPDALFVAIFGQTITAVRLVSVLTGTFTVLGLYLLVREVSHRKTALLATGFLALLAPHIHFSRTAFHNILPGFFAVWLLWLAFRALRNGRISSAIWLGLATGAAFYTYLGSRLAMVLAGLVFLVGCLLQPNGLRQRWQHLLAAALTGLVVLLPMAVFFLQHPDHFSARLTAETVMRDPLMATSGTHLILRQAARSALVFISQPATYGFYHSDRAYLPFIAAILMVLGMGWSVAHIKRLPMAILLAWWLSVVILGGALTSAAPASQRLVMALPAAAWLCALGATAAGYLLEQNRVSRIIVVLICLGLILVPAVQSVDYYLRIYPAKGGYGDRSNELIVESAALARSLGPAYRFVLLGGGYVQIEFASYQYLLTGYDLTQASNETDWSDYTPDDAHGLLVIAAPEDSATLEQVMEALPGGETQTFYRRVYTDDPLFTAYWLPPQ